MGDHAWLHAIAGGVDAVHHVDERTSVFSDTDLV